MVVAKAKIIKKAFNGIQVKRLLSLKTLVTLLAHKLKTSRLLNGYCEKLISRTIEYYKVFSKLQYIIIIDFAETKSHSFFYFSNIYTVRVYKYGVSGKRNMFK